MYILYVITRALSFMRIFFEFNASFTSRKTIRRKIVLTIFCQPSVFRTLVYRLLDKYWKFKFIYFTYIRIHQILYIHIHVILYINTYIWYFTFGDSCMENSKSASFAQLPCHDRFIICNYMIFFLRTSKRATSKSMVRAL